MQPYATSPLLLGLDLGTTNAKAAVYDPTGRLVAAYTVAYPTSYPKPGWAEQRPADWVGALTAACQQVVIALGQRKDDLVGIGLSTHGPGVILIDDQGQPLLPTSPIWQDTRCLAHGQRLIDQVGPGWTGLGLLPNSFPAKLAWIVEHESQAAQQACYALGIKDYVAYWLTGEVASEPSTVAGDTQWWPSLFTAFGWSVERLAPVAPSTAVIGQVRSALAQQLDLPASLPVVIGLADGAAATLSMGACQVNEVVLTLATSGVLRVVVAAPPAPPIRLAHALFCWPYLPGLWIAGGHLQAGASVLQWFTRIQQPSTANAERDPSSINHLLAAASMSPPGSRGVLFLPYLLGRGSPHADASATGAFLGLRMEHEQSDLARALLEGVAFAFREVLDDFIAIGYRGDHIRMSGGGAASPLWRQILADVLECPLTHFAADSSLGAAMLTAVGLGLYPAIPAAVTSMVHTKGVNEPNRANQTIYQQGYDAYQRNVKGHA
jgi:xylulokinase